MGVYENVKRALQDVVAPELRALQGEIKRLDGKIDSGYKSLNEKMDSLHSEVLSEIKRLDGKIDSGYEKLDGKIDSGYNRLNDKVSSLRNEVLSEIKRLDGKIDSLGSQLQIAINIRERLAKVESKLAISS